VSRSQFPKPRHLADALLAEGTSWVTTAEIARRLGISEDAVSDSLERAREAGRMLAITKGAWLVVPPEYLRWGAPPPAHFVDDWMRHLGHPYYVGLLSAAAHHGLTHHAPQVFQVVTSARLRDRRIGRASIEFVVARRAAERPTDSVVVPTGRIRVASVEVTLLDLIAHPGRAGGLSNAAAIAMAAVVEGRFDAGKTVVAAGSYRPGALQRLGFVVEQAAVEAGIPVDLDSLAASAAAQRVVPLATGEAAGGPVDPRWRVTVNSRLELDA